MNLFPIQVEAGFGIVNRGLALLPSHVSIDNGAWPTSYVILPSIRAIGSFFTTISPVEEDESCESMLVSCARA